MAIRYSGDVRVRILFVDALGGYDAKVSWPGGRTSLLVGPPAALTRAVDSSESYDDAARAALSFVSADHSIPCAWDGSGPYVSRRESVRAGGAPSPRRG